MKKIGLVVNPRKPDAVKAVEAFFLKMQSTEFKLLLSNDVKSQVRLAGTAVNFVSDSELLKESQLIITFGGDGTILRTIQMIGEKEIPVLGVNVGSLGFLAATSLKNVYSHINEFFTNKFKIENRAILQLEIKKEQITKFALNDFVIDKAGFYRVINIKTSIEDHLLNSYIADGLIISTPTGSTAYSLANGGPIVLPQTGAFIVNPVCPHTLTNRPVIISDQSIITLEVHSELGHFNIFGDGQNIGSFDSGTTIRICRAKFNAKLVQIPEQSFYKTLSSKLGWGEDFRNKIRWQDK